MNTTYQNPQADQWFQSVTADWSRFPFAFTYRGTRYKGFSPEQFSLVSETETVEGSKMTRTLVWNLDDSLQVTLKCAHDTDFGASEWTVWFANPSETESGLLENPESTLTFAGSYPVLKGILGDHGNQYRPYAIDLQQTPTCFESNSGRATHVNFPYFNLEYGEQGVMLAIGWAGTWRVDFRFVGGETTATLRSVNGLHTVLKPGETIRTALFVRAAYQTREEHFATNYWRHWFLQKNLPKMDKNGTPATPFSTCCLASDTGLPNSDGSISERHFTWKPSLEKMFAENVKVDFRWFDAGWYIAPDGTSPESNWWGTVGTWTIDPNKWPGNSFRESTDFARANGMKTLMWFEPERITDPESLVKNYGYQLEWAIRREGNTAISNNIGDPACFRWTVDRIKKTLSENRVEMYREDNNSDPSTLWAYLDAREGEHRQGITECKFIDAHYRMWDELIECTLSYGGCGFVDSCASGGGRNDLESLRRGIPLLRSDHDRKSVAIRLSMTTAFNKWVPFCGANSKEKKGELDATGASDPYVWRASYLPVLNVDSQFVQDPDQDFGILRFGLSEWKRVNRYLLQDFYVLTPWHTEYDTNSFTAYSYFDPATRDGILLAFRQEACVEDCYTATLPYANESATYTLTDEDTGEQIRVSGAEMRRNGVALHFPQPRSARLLWVTEE